ncbi:MAG: hypothetical protein EHM40_13450 [Chloroflexi bacterium]|nr:MAG: hypothetical protein EHM40_13450 [Chloroflexota bacterium]
MTRRLLTVALVIILALSLTTSVLAQSYSFSLDREVVNVYWNSDGTQSLDYVFTFSNQPGAHEIDFVDVGLPNENYAYNTISADVNGTPVSISRDYQGSGSGVAVDLGSQAIQPGQTGSVHVFVGQITGVVYPDDDDENYASAVFSPTWFGSEYVVGDTDLTVTFHLPPGVKPEEPHWHAAPSGFPSEPETGLDSEGRVTYTWSNPSASGSRQYTFGASFPKTYIPAEAIVTPPAFDLGGWISSIFASFGQFAFCCFFIFMFLGIPILNAVGQQRRKLQYMSPKIEIEGHGIKRGLTAVEAAILMEQQLDKVMTMILFGVVKKGAATVTKREPLQVQVTSPTPEGLHEYELNFLTAMKETDNKTRRDLLQEMTVKLVRSVSEKMKGFSRKETLEYYKRIMETAWEQVQKADTPEMQMSFFDQKLEWTMLDKDYDDRSRRVFTGPIFVPMWWGHYDPTYRTGPISTSGGGGVSAPRAPSSGRTSLPGAEFAASVVGGVQTFSQKVIGNVQDFTSRVTNVTNPPPKPSTGGRSGGGRSGGCACACACAGCACACAGGGR